eukprot:TRINITY_DN869_c0_g1_i3.p2 TRINITY_DN869_c0_g1~~TRINITY_DN869_c0_g1_i3.p2  ORF type:complete len:125 (-),score=18.48 TRINITY_DN869_c0_g1_i3:224-598(-)
MDSTTRITFTVKDKDTTSHDDLMGMRLLMPSHIIAQLSFSGVLDIGLKPLEDQQMREQWWALNEAEDLNYDISGDLHLQLILDTSSTPNKLNVKGNLLSFINQWFSHENLSPYNSCGSTKYSSS